jgi:phenylacetate-CoA ligase
MAGKRDLFPHDASLEFLPEKERDSILSASLRRLIRHAYRNAPGFTARMDAAGIKASQIQGTRDLQRIPVLRKDDLIRLQGERPPFGGYLAMPLEEVEHVYQSPGPIYDPQRSVHNDFGLPGIGKGQVAINTWAYQVTPAGMIMDRVLRNMGFTVFPAGPGNTDLLLQVMRSLQAACFVGSPSFLMSIIKKAEEQGLDFRKDFNLKYALAFGEMGGDALRQAFSDKYGIECPGGDVYVTADTGIIAISCAPGAGMHVSTDMIVEIVDPATGAPLPPGQAGEVVVTPFDEVYPLVRFGTGDLSMLATGKCSCGRTTPRLPKIMGRTGDAVRVRAMFVHPRQTDEVFSRCPEVSSYQLVVTRRNDRDEMLLQFELSQEPGDMEAWLETLRKQFQEVCKVRFDRAETVKPGTIPGDARRIVDRRVY